MARGSPGEAVDQPSVSPEDMPRKLVPRFNEVSLGTGIEDFTAAINHKYVADSATFAGDQLAQARVKAVNDLETAKQNAPPGDQTGFTEKFLASFDKEAGQTLQAANGNKVATAMLSKGLSDLRDTLYTHTQDWVAQQNVKYRTDSVQNNLEAQLPVVQAHPELATQVGSTLADQIRSVGGGNETMLPMLRTMHQKLSEAAAEGYARQDPKGMLDALTNPEKAPAAYQSAISGLTDVQREAMLARAQGHVSSAVSDGIVGAYRSGGPMAGARALAGVDNMDLTPEVKQQIRTDVETGVKQWRDEMRQTHAQDILGLESRLSADKPDPQDRNVALSLFHSGAWDAAQTGETIGRIEKAQEKKVGDDAMRTYVSTAYQNGTPLDPHDDQTRKAADDVFTFATNHVPPGSPEWINRAADMGAKTGVTPDSAISWSRTQLVSGDPASAANAANAVARLQAANPRGIGYALDDKTKALARSISDAVQAGTDPKVAVENARNISTMPDAEKNRLEEVWKGQIDKAGPNQLVSALKDTSNGFRQHFWQSIPDVPPQMTGQFETLRHQYFTLTGGNVTQANALAVGDLKNTWGISEVNGKREFMPFAPEAMNPGLTAAAVRADMEKSVAGMTADPSKVRLIATPDTYQSNGQRWGIGVPDKYGAYTLIQDKQGRALPYQLPTGAQALKDQQVQAAQQGLAKLHELQTIQHAQDKNEMGEVINQGHRMGGF